MSRKMKPELTHGKTENWDNIIAKKQNLYLKCSSLKKQAQTKQDKIKPKTLHAQITLLVNLPKHLRSTYLRNNTSPSQNFREQK